uniref:ATP synthase complex subunit 8 n=1 Tax=Alleculinae sp. ENSP01 TaxID=1205808 RepID=A0A0S2MPM1_9CUCU|nr:ATP synthase F0 subunit 8 [Alleculinae sp. ENSP01]
MPQMAPLNWLMLMIMFSLILVTFNIMNFYSFPNKLKKLGKKFSKKNINWKW